MKKKLFGVSSLILMTMSSLFGCGKTEVIKDASDDGSAIIHEMKLLSEAFDSHDANQIYDLLADDIKDDSVLEQLNDFEKVYSKSKKVYVNAKTYWMEHGESKSFSMVSGIIITEDNIYTVKFDFNENDNELTKLWIITGETESTENLTWENGYQFDKSEKFVYANYHDKGQVDYRLIWGMVVKWDENANTVDPDDIKDMVSDNTSMDEITNTFGRYGADVKEAEHFYCYPTKTNGEYAQIFVDENGVVSKVETTDAIDYGIMGLTEVK